MNDKMPEHKTEDILPPKPVVSPTSRTRKWLSFLTNQRQTPGSASSGGSSSSNHENHHVAVSTNPAGPLPAPEQQGESHPQSAATKSTPTAPMPINDTPSPTSAAEMKGLLSQIPAFNSHNFFLNLTKYPGMASLVCGIYILAANIHETKAEHALAYVSIVCGAYTFVMWMHAKTFERWIDSWKKTSYALLAKVWQLVAAVALDASYISLIAIVSIELARGNLKKLVDSDTTVSSTTPHANLRDGLPGSTISTSLLATSTSTTTESSHHSDRRTSMIVIIVLSSVSALVGIVLAGLALKHAIMAKRKFRVIVVSHQNSVQLNSIKPLPDEEIVERV